MVKKHFQFHTIFYSTWSQGHLDMLILVLRKTHISGKSHKMLHRYLNFDQKKGEMSN